MLRLFIVLIFSAFIGTAALADESDRCGPGTHEAFVSKLSKVKSCGAAYKNYSECLEGSSLDLEPRDIVVKTCEQEFLTRLTPAQESVYRDRMQFCAYRVSRQQGTIYLSEMAVCQAGVAAAFAAHPTSEAGKPIGQASFDCAKAGSPLENAICSDVKLGHADVALAQAYATATKSMSESARAALIADEKRWLAEVAARCHPTEGAPFSNKEKDCARAAFEIRFTALDICADGDGASVVNCLPSTMTDLSKDTGTAQ